MNQLSNLSRFYKSLMEQSNIFSRLFILIISAMAIALTPQSASAAERLRFNYGILGFDLSIDSLELYAEEGKINSELAFYTNRLDERTVKQLRRVLRRRININPILLYRLTRLANGSRNSEKFGRGSNNASGSEWLPCHTGFNN